MRSPAGRGGGGLRRRLPGDGCSGGRRQRKGATTALPGRRRSRVTVAPGRPSRVRPRRADRPSQEVIDPGPTSRDEGDDAHRIRYRLDCRRSRSQGQRPFRVADRPFADTFGRASSRRSLAGQERSPSMFLFATLRGAKRTPAGSKDSILAPFPLTVEAAAVVVQGVPLRLL